MIARAFSGSLVDPSVRSVNRICRLGVNKGMCTCVLCARACVCVRACVCMCVCVYAQAHKKHNKGNV